VREGVKRDAFFVNGEYTSLIQMVTFTVICFTSGELTCSNSGSARARVESSAAEADHQRKEVVEDVLQLKTLKSHARLVGYAW